MQRARRPSIGHLLSRFNPHRPFRAGATPRSGGRARSQPVSILTGPFGPVQHWDCRERATGALVSILTGPFGPVQLEARDLDWGVSSVFQSSPALSGRCNSTFATHWFALVAFQSSPALSGRCNSPIGLLTLGAARVSILTGPFGPVQPSAALYAVAWASRFNPHRPFRAGATEAIHPDDVIIIDVSILTGPFGPVQPP